MKIEKLRKTGWVESIKKRNKDFKKLSRKRRVVELCKESLILIKSGVMVACQGTYVGHTIRFMRNNEDITENTQIQKIIPQIEGCQVCVKGSMMLSSISFRNDFDIADAEFGVGNSEVLEKLDDDIMKDELDLMESVFESGDTLYEGHFTEAASDPKKAKTYWTRYNVKDQHQALWHLLQNIIHCKGDVIKAITKKDTGMGKLRYPKVVTE